MEISYWIPDVIFGSLAQPDGRKAGGRAGGALVTGKPVLGLTRALLTVLCALAQRKQQC